MHLMDAGTNSDLAPKYRVGISRCGLGSGDVDFAFADAHLPEE